MRGRCRHGDCCAEPARRYHCRCSKRPTGEGLTCVIDSCDFPLIPKAMADKGGSSRSKARAASELRHSPPLGSSFDALVTALGGGMLDFQSMLAIADILPVLTAYIDRELIYRFVNKPYAEWLEMPRKEILGRPMEEVLGSELFAVRRPMLEAAMAGERKFFVADFEHPTRG